jgi:hypothetical protein
LTRYREGGVAAGLEVVGEGDPEAFGLAGIGEASGAVAKIGREPEVGVAGEIQSESYGLLGAERSYGDGYPHSIPTEVAQR